jgi:hypothetical protein
VALDQREIVGVAVQAHTPLLVPRPVHHFDLEASIGMFDGHQASSRRDSAAPTHERVPNAVGLALEQQHLDETPTGLAHPQPRSQHASAIRDEQIAWFEQFWEIPDVSVVGIDGGATIDEQARRVSR